MLILSYVPHMEHYPKKTFNGISNVKGQGTQVYGMISYNTYFTNGNFLVENYQPKCVL